ncbi:isoaspartyl peptidase/L-asparaginase family protein [Sinimarinibacterium thermocellulolyticum]|uniref:Isoaspartyl peptidase/L-asparaginase n=1 Tax=Sinimarinibacterium thermocellulolyticum TaxID=3170016 RepID=A0ABV2ADJ3_9GAMM
MIRLALHGGAGELALDRTDTREQRSALRRIAERGRQMLQDGAAALDVVEQTVVLLEECPLFNAGIGAVLNRDGQPELDAAIMSGIDRACGAVAGVMRAKSPIRLARAVMERSPHVLFTGAGAEALNRELGLEEVTPDHFITEVRLRQLEDAHARGVITLDHDDAAFGTVGAVARDAEGHLAAATSTGGLTNKQPGRVGDTPIIGAGTFADDRSAAVSCTGTGEAFIRSGFGFEIHARMSYCGWELARACREGLDEVRRLGGRGGCIAIDHEGEIALPFNSAAMFRAWMGADGNIHVAVGPDDAD